MDEEKYITPEKRAEVAQSKRLALRAKHLDSKERLLEDLVDQANVQRLNQQALVQVMAEFNIQISPRDFANWRPTQRSLGEVQGIWSAVTIVATNGLLAWFTNELQETFSGHIQFFTGDVLPLYSTQKERRLIEEKERVRKSPRKKKEKSKRAQLLEEI